LCLDLDISKYVRIVYEIRNLKAVLILKTTRKKVASGNENVGIATKFSTRAELGPLLGQSGLAGGVVGRFAGL